MESVVKKRRQAEFIAVLYPVMVTLRRGKGMRLESCGFAATPWLGHNGANERRSRITGVEEQMTVGLWSLLMLLAVLLAGLLGFWIGRSTSQERRLIRELEAELDHRMQELNRYRAAVNQHFDRTATLFAGMAGAYRDLYHHLAESCEELVDKSTRERLEDRAGRVLANVPVRDPVDTAAMPHAVGISGTRRATAGPAGPVGTASTSSSLPGWTSTRPESGAGPARRPPEPKAPRPD